MEDQELNRPHSAPCIAQENKEQQVKNSQSVPCIAKNVEKHGTKLPKSVSFNVKGVEEKGKKLPQLAPSNTGKSFSEALILASVNSQYDKRLFIEFTGKYKFKTFCLQILF